MINKGTWERRSDAEVRSASGVLSPSDENISPYNLGTRIHVLKSCIRGYVHLLTFQLSCVRLIQGNQSFGSTCHCWYFSVAVCRLWYVHLTAQQHSILSGFSHGHRQLRLSVRQRTTVTPPPPPMRTSSEFLGLVK